MKTYFGILLTLVLLVCSCKEELSKNKSIEGVWQSIGHGKILNIKADQYDFYDLTKISCLPARQGNISDFGNDIQLHKDTLMIAEPIFTFNFIRSKKLPDLCATVWEEKKAKEPLYNFEVFAETVKEHYAFMKHNNVNWEELYHQQKNKLSKHSSEAELYLIIEETFEKLNDNHAFLDAPDDVYDAIEKLEEEEENGEEELPELGDFPTAQMVAAHHLQEEMTKDSWLIQWGKMTDELGYIQLKAMCLFADLELSKASIDSLGFVDAYGAKRVKMYVGEYMEKEVKGVRKIMDRVMNDLADTQSIIIDVRFNGGGQDVVSLEILSRFNADKLKIGTHKVSYGNKYTAEKPIFLEGTKRPYTKPVYVLTSSQTGSAAETFSLATMSMTNVKRIGSATEGAMSTTLDKKLPNGWDFCLSSEILMDHNGNFYENVGVPSDYKINYSRDRQTFFRSIVNDLDADKQNILKAIKALQTN